MLWLADVVTPTRSVLKVRVLASAFALLAPLLLLAHLSGDEADADSRIWSLFGVGCLTGLIAGGVVAAVGWRRQRHDSGQDYHQRPMSRGIAGVAPGAGIGGLLLLGPPSLFAVVVGLVGGLLASVALMPTTVLSRYSAHP